MRRQGRQLQPGLFNNAKVRGWKRAEEYAAVPLDTTLTPVDAAESQSDTGGDY